MVTESKTRASREPHTQDGTLLLALATVDVVFLAGFHVWIFVSLVRTVDVKHNQ